LRHVDHAQSFELHVTFPLPNFASASALTPSASRI
jgi:hypothetical protein